MHFVLVGFLLIEKVRRHLLAQLSKSWRSWFMSSSTCFQLAAVFQRARSSAKSEILEVMFVVQSLMKRRKRSGDKTDPCGTPVVIDRVVEIVLGGR